MFLSDDFANRFLQTPFETEKTSGRNGAKGTVNKCAILFMCIAPYKQQYREQKCNRGADLEESDFEMEEKTKSSTSFLHLGAVEFSSRMKFVLHYSCDKPRLAFSVAWFSRQIRYACATSPQTTRFAIFIRNEVRFQFS